MEDRGAGALALVIAPLLVHGQPLSCLRSYRIPFLSPQIFLTSSVCAHCADLPLANYTMPYSTISARLANEDPISVYKHLADLGRVPNANNTVILEVSKQPPMWVCTVDFTVEGPTATLPIHGTGNDAQKKGAKRLALRRALEQIGMYLLP